MMEVSIKLNNSGVYFDELTHTYLRESDDKILKGITTTLLDRAFPDTYSGVPDDVIKHAQERGTAVHKAVESFVNDERFSDDFISVVAEASQLLRQRGLEPVATEYVVTDGENYASPIDILCLDKKKNVCIVDIKTTSKKMYEHVQLQCSIYKVFFERQNPGVPVKGLFCLWLHVNDEYDILESDLYEMEPVDSEYIEHLIECDLEDEPFLPEKFYGNLPVQLKDVEGYLQELDVLVKEKTEELKTIKEGLLAMMQENNVKSFDSGRTKLTRMMSQIRTSFDEARFKEEHPDLYKEYLTKQTKTKESIRITFK